MPPTSVAITIRNHLDLRMGRYLSGSRSREGSSWTVPGHRDPASDHSPDRRGLARSRALMAPPKATPGPDCSAGCTPGHTARDLVADGRSSVAVSGRFGHRAQFPFSTAPREMQPVVQSAGAGRRVGVAVRATGPSLEHASGAVEKDDGDRSWRLGAYQTRATWSASGHSRRRTSSSRPHAARRVSTTPDTGSTPVTTRARCTADQVER